MLSHSAILPEKNTDEKRVLRMLRTSRAILLVGVLLLLLGAGNLLVGYNRADDYEKLLLEYHSQYQIRDVKAPRVENDKNLQYLQARYGFYRFCILGGKCFLALAAICMLTSLILLPAREETQETPVK